MDTTLHGEAFSAGLGSGLAPPAGKDIKPEVKLTKTCFSCGCGLTTCWWPFCILMGSSELGGCPFILFSLLSLRSICLPHSFCMTLRIRAPLSSFLPSFSALNGHIKNQDCSGRRRREFIPLHLLSHDERFKHFWRSNAASDST